MTDEEYKEPTNEQLANFMMVYSSRIVGEHNLDLNPAVLERLIETNPMYRAAALRHHRRFVEEMKELHDKMMRGKLRCAHIRANDKKCVNFNQPGSFFCGLHKELYEEDLTTVTKEKE